MSGPTLSRTQVVRPAGAGHETLYVLLVSLLIVALASTVVLLRGEREDEQVIASHQIDARRDLSAAEQGIYTDLRVAFDEIQLLREETASTPPWKCWPRRACHRSWWTPAARAVVATSGRGCRSAPTSARARRRK